MSDESQSPLASQILELAAKLALQEARIVTQEARIAVQEAKIAELEAQVSQTKKVKKTPQTLKRRNIPSGLPEGTIAIRDFYTEKGVPLHYVRSHIERGIYGDLLETTDVPHATRKDFMYHYLTPEQQKKAIEFWDRNNIEYEK